MANGEVDIESREAAAQSAQSGLVKSTRGIRDLIQGEEFKSAVKAALPRAMRPERFVRVALNAIMRQPDLLNCTKESFFRCMLDLSMFGLEPDGRRAHLIPFRNNKECTCGHPKDQHRGAECVHCKCKQFTVRVDCTLIVDYKGLAELVRRSGDVSFIHADIVYEHDEFEFAYGSNAVLKHKPNMDDRGNKKICVYSFVRLKDGSEDFTVMSIAEVNNIRKRSRAADSGPWVSDYDEMAKKTVFRRHSKWLPLSPETRDAVERDDEQIDFGGMGVTENTATAIAGESGNDRVKRALADRKAELEPGDEATAAKDPNAGPQEPAKEAPEPSTTQTTRIEDGRTLRDYAEFPDPVAEDGVRIFVKGQPYVSAAGSWKSAVPPKKRERGQMNFGGGE
jgi:recombination protein RecT